MIKINTEVKKRNPEFSTKIETLVNDPITQANLSTDPDVILRDGRLRVLTFDIPIIPRDGYYKESQIKKYTVTVTLNSKNNQHIYWKLE